MNCDKFHLTPAIAKLQGIFYMQNGMCFRHLSIKASQALPIMYNKLRKLKTAKKKDNVQ